MVNEQDTFEMIHLVLEAGREKLVAIFFVAHAVVIEIADAAMGGALDVFVESGTERQPSS